MATPLKTGRARVKNYFAGDSNNIEFSLITVDPRIGLGVPARPGSLASRQVGNDVELYQKFGVLNTNWRLLTSFAAGGVTGACFEFEVGDWVTCDAGENYCLDLVHNFNSECLTVNSFEIISGDFVKVQPQDMIVLSVNSIRLKVSKLGVDGRFQGQASIFKV